MKDDGVLNEAVDGGHGGHRIAEDLLPLAEDLNQSDIHK
jgi:hypothetical protein